MLLPKNWHTLALNQKFAYALALAQERRDAQKARKRTGSRRSQKPRCGQNSGAKTVQCGAVCRLPENCKVSKREQGYLEKMGATPEDISRAAKAKRGEGLALGEIQRELRNRRSQVIAEARAVPAPALGRLNKDGSVTLGEPLHKKVSTPSEAIANGRAILGELLEEMQSPTLDEQFQSAHEDQLRRAREAREKSDQIFKTVSAMEREGADRESIQGLKEELNQLNRTIANLSRPTEQTPEGRALVSIERANLTIAYWEREGIDKYEPEAYKNWLDIRDEAISEGRYSQPVAAKVIQALIDTSSVSQEDAERLVKQVEMQGNLPPEVSQSLIEVARLTNGQCLAGLDYVKSIASDDRSCAVQSTGLPGSKDMIRGGVFLSENQVDQKWVIYHETAHHIEFEPHNLAVGIGPQFVRDRATGDPQPLSRVGAGGLFYGYGDDEIAYPGNFINPYMGKVYKGENYSEVISMGVQDFVDSSRLSHLAKADPEFLALVVGVMRQEYDIGDIQRRKDEIKDREAKRANDAVALTKYSKDIKRKYPPASKSGDSLDFEDFVAEGGRKGVSLEFSDGGFGFVRLNKTDQRLFMSWLKSRPDLYPRFGKMSANESEVIGDMFTAILNGRVEDIPGGGSMALPDFDIVKFLQTFDPFDLAKGRQDSQDSSPVVHGYGLNPAPFYKPLWVVMGIQRWE